MWKQIAISFFRGFLFCTFAIYRSSRHYNLLHFFLISEVQLLKDQWRKSWSPCSHQSLSLFETPLLEMAAICVCLTSFP